MILYIFKITFEFEYKVQQLQKDDTVNVLLFLI